MMTTSVAVQTLVSKSHSGLSSNRARMQIKHIQSLKYNGWFTFSKVSKWPAMTGSEGRTTVSE